MDEELDDLRVALENRQIERTRLAQVETFFVVQLRPLLDDKVDNFQIA